MLIVEREEERYREVLEAYWPLIRLQTDVTTLLHYAMEHSGMTFPITVPDCAKFRLRASDSLELFANAESKLSRRADSFESFAKDGLSRMDSVYAMEEVMPYRVPLDDYLASLITNGNNLEELGNIIRRKGCRSYDFEPLFGFLDNRFMTIGDDVEDVSAQHSEFLTPNREMSLRGLGAFMSMSKRLCCMHRVIGALGNKDGSIFTIRLYIVVTGDGTVYGYDMSLDTVTRLADDLNMFFKIGAQKSVCNFRFCRGDHGVRRLEKPPVCPHVLKISRWVADDGAVCESRRELEDAFSLRAMTQLGELIGFRDRVPCCSSTFDIVVDVGVNKPDGVLAIDLCRYFHVLHVLESVQNRHSSVDGIWAEELRVIARSGLSCVCREDVDLKSQLMALIKDDDAISSEEDLSDDENPIKWVRFMFSDPCKRCVGRYRLKVYARCRNAVAVLF
ncbi:B36 [miniopterid betaherpesvirus 1]|uniref:B36 n=1 Tax=miniopterid betaherpesvirus 1 TaxID=3070189 RepID=I3VQ11_9BETA|nr:B36 [miniopterid betaherpesvirus 1]AFK83855.1 B36 [miniopterid betaherpesvirus 1]